MFNLLFILINTYNKVTTAVSTSTPSMITIANIPAKGTGASLESGIIGVAEVDVPPSDAVRVDNVDVEVDVEVEVEVDVDVDVEVEVEVEVEVDVEVEDVISSVVLVSVVPVSVVLLESVVLLVSVVLVSIVLVSSEPAGPPIDGLREGQANEEATHIEYKHVTGSDML